MITYYMLWYAYFAIIAVAFAFAFNTFKMFVKTILGK